MPYRLVLGPSFSGHANVRQAIKKLQQQERRDMTPN